MLREVLGEIARADYISKSNIALKLDVSQGLVEDSFSQLLRMGYIEEFATDECNLECKGCAYANICNRSPIKTMKLTEKGKKLLNK